MTAKEWIQKELEKAENTLKISCSTKTREKAIEKQYNCGQILKALDCAEELAYYRMLDSQMKSRFGVSIGQYLDVRYAKND